MIKKVKKEIEISINVEQAINDLKIFFGLPPHDGGSNYCKSDGYFASSLVKKYGLPLEDLIKAVEFDKILTKWEGLRNQL